MGAWHATYANLLRTRFGALVAYASLLTDHTAVARDLAQDASVAVFSARRAPRDTHEAEIACREWMAAHAESPERAATVLIAIDSLDGDGIHRVLREKAPVALPVVTHDEVAELRARFTSLAAVYAVPSGGVNALLAPARRAHYASIGKTFGGLAGATAGVAVLAYVGIPFLPLGVVTATEPSPSATPNAPISVTWDPEADYETALAGFHMPECGERFAPEAQAVGGVMPKPTGQIETDADFGDMVMLSAGFTVEADGARWLLADPSGFVVTRDDEVVLTRTAEYNGLEAFYAKGVAAGGMGFGRASFCDAQAASEKLNRTLGYFDYENASLEERTAYDAEWENFYEEWTAFEPGLYRVYLVTPMVFGEQAALGQAFKREGVSQVQAITWDIAYSPLAEDPRAAPYCSGSYDVGDLACDIPADVLREILTREIDPATIDDIAPGMGISEPLAFDLG